MDSNSLNFEIPRKQLVYSALKGILLSQLLCTGLFIGYYAIFSSFIPYDLPHEQRDEFLHMLVKPLGWAWLAVFLLTTFATVFSLNFTASKVLINDQFLDIDTFWQSHRLRWGEVAEVRRINRAWRTFLWIVTWDAGIIQVSPPLTPLDTLEKEISSRALDAIGAPPRPGQRPIDERRRDLFFATLARGVRQSLFVFAAIAVLVGAFKFWTTVREPSIEVPSFGESPLRLGKKAWLDAWNIHNYGRDTRGLDIEVSGDALEKELLRNPVVLIDSVDRSKFSFPPRMKNQARELLALAQVKKGVWAATSKSASLKHEDNMFFQALDFTSSGLFGGTLWEREQSVTLFADVPKKGKGTVIIKIAPSGFSSVELKVKLTTIIENDGAATPIASVGVPKEFPVSAYPGSQIELLSSWDVKLYSDATDKDVIAFYKDELKRKGWKTVESRDKHNKTTLSAKKHKDKLTVEIDPDFESGTHVQLLLNFL